MKVLTLARKPFKGTVAHNMLTHGCGGINIKASRVGSEQVSTHSRGSNQAFPKRPTETTVEESGRKARQDILDHAPRTGRWPTNLILSHLDGCRIEGTRKVKCSNPTRADGTIRTGDNEIYGKRDDVPLSNTNYADESGMEETPNWVCVEGCPVKALDEQSGVSQSPSTYTRSVASGNLMVWGEGVGDKAGVESLNYGDSGGASRFFKQVKP